MITDPDVYAVGWLSRYCKALKCTRCPSSFILLTGMWAFSTLMGRRMSVVRNGYRLYPPISILLLGDSGVGKSHALRQARRLIETAVMTNEDMSHFLQMHATKFSPRGLSDAWKKHQQEDHPGFNKPLEGAVSANELKAILNKRSTGSENTPQWIIDVLEHDDMTDWTGYKGRTHVRAITVAMAFCSTLDDLYEIITVNEFTGGFMHRFLVVHETKKTAAAEVDIDWEVLNELAMEALEIRNNVIRMEVDRDASLDLDVLRNLAETRPRASRRLSGFWNRFDGIIAKLAMVRALSDGRSNVMRKDVEASRVLLEEYIYRSLVPLVEELGASPKMRELFAIADDLHAAGEEGILKSTLQKRMPAVSVSGQADLLSVMENCGLVYFNPRRDRGWRYKVDVRLT